MSDIKKYALMNLNIIMNDLELKEGQELELDNKLIDILSYELADSHEISVKYTISNIFVNMTNASSSITEKIAEVEFIQKLFELSYGIYMPFVENLLIILGNILIDHPKETLNIILKQIPIIIRLKELLDSNEIQNNTGVLSAIFSLLKNISRLLDEKNKIIVLFLFTLVD